jgi:putative transposase
VFLSAFETGREARNGIGSWIDYYNRRRPHSAFDGRTPEEVYAMAEIAEQLAA